MSLEVVSARVREAATTLVFASLLALVAAMVVGLWLADRPVKPVQALTTVARRIADEGDLTQALPLADSGDEVDGTWRAAHAAPRRRRRSQQTQQPGELAVVRRSHDCEL